MILFRGYEDIESVFLQAGKDSDWLSLREYEDLLEEVRHLTFECERRHGTHGMIFLSNLAEGGGVDDTVAAADIFRLHQRVLKRMQPGDSAVTFDYLYMLERLYQELFDKFEGPKIKVVNDEGNTMETLSKIRSFLNSI